MRKIARDASAKTVDPSVIPLPGGEDLSYLFAGTLVVRGAGKALVHAAGIKSEMGKIGRALSNIETEQPHLQRHVHSFVKVFAIVSVNTRMPLAQPFALLSGDHEPKS